VPSRSAIPAVFLPGMDGSGRLYRPLLDAEPRAIAPRLVSYPGDEPLGYDALLELTRAAVPPRGKWVLLAESFSGPVAIRLAAERPRGLVALVLAATFLHRPLNPVLHPLRTLVGVRFFALGLPAAAIRHFMAGPDAPDALVADVQAAVGAVTPDTMARRAAEAAAVDVRKDLARVEVPLLYLAPTRDRLLRTDVVEEILAIQPDAEIALLEAPHMILQRAPQASLARIEAFVRNPGARAGAVM
jgi:pimeloyl-[acyl-carrier protein] methyl ester esterase